MTDHQERDGIALPDPLRERGCYQPFKAATRGAAAA
jgi:hypothetical protein